MRAPTAARLENSDSGSEKCSPDSFRWPNVFLMQPCDLWCCHSAGLVGMPGWTPVGGRRGLRVGEGRLIKSVLTELTERAASLEVQKQAGSPAADGGINEWMNEPGLFSTAVKERQDTVGLQRSFTSVTPLQRRVHFSLLCASVLISSVVCVVVLCCCCCFIFFWDVLCCHQAAMHHQVKLISHRAHSTTVHFFARS